jgi:hypothetical protein
MEQLFSADEANAARKLLEDHCADNLPFCDQYSPEQMDRIRIAALKVSQGNYEALEKAVKLAQTDWRDLLMAADFGHDTQAHTRWIPEHPSS